VTRTLSGVYGSGREEFWTVRSTRTGNCLNGCSFWFNCVCHCNLFSSIFHFSAVAYLMFPFFIFHLFESLLPVGVDGSQRAFRLSWSRAIALTPSHSVLLSFKIIFIHSYPSLVVFLSCVLACQAVRGVSLIPCSYRVPKPYQLC